MGELYKNTFLSTTEGCHEGIRKTLNIWKDVGFFLSPIWFSCNFHYISYENHSSPMEWQEGKALSAASSLALHWPSGTMKRDLQNLPKPLNLSHLAYVSSDCHGLCFLSMKFPAQNSTPAPYTPEAILCGWQPLGPMPAWPLILLCLLLVGDPEPTTSPLGLRLLICKMGVIVVPSSGGSGEDYLV